MNTYEELAQAIILQAVKDYRQNNKRMANKPEEQKLRNQRAELEKFFLSSWFAILTDLNGKHLLHRLQAEMKGMAVKGT